MDNWHAEAARFLPGLRVRLWRGEDAAALIEARPQFDLIVLNYSQLRALSPDIAAMRWHAVVLDEAQYIKNPDSQTAQVARSLQAAHRLALTGTPIENRLLDLWSILAYRLLMKNSVEEKIRKLQQTKAALADDVLGEETFARSLTLDDLRFIFSED